MKERTCAALALMALALGTDAAVAKCHVPFFRTLNNQTVTGQMYADSGRPCPIRMMASSGPAQSLAIQQRPANGSVQTSGHAVIYRSRPGYVGKDEFTFALRARDVRNNAVVKTVQVVVSVK